jgi:alpha-galactosidase
MKNISLFFICLCLLSLSWTSDKLGITDNVIQALKHSQPVVYLKAGTSTDSVVVKRKWHGNTCESLLKNISSSAVYVKEVVLFREGNLLPGSTLFYGEGFQMLSQSNGTLSKVNDIGRYRDAGWYRLPEPSGYHAVYNLMYLKLDEVNNLLMAFSSCNRFSGKFYFSSDSIKVVMNLEGLKLEPGQSFTLEKFSYYQGRKRAKLFYELALDLKHNYPSTLPKFPPNGWCSWGDFYNNINEKKIRQQVDYIHQHIPSLKYIQIDDGYEPNYGDWLQTKPSYDGSMKATAQYIENKGMQPGIWLSPFVCDSNSTIFRDHKDWLVKDQNGEPLLSSKVIADRSWFVLDGTNPAVQTYFEQLFNKMRSDWGITYFKLDFLYWGAIQGGYFYDKNATRIQAYREGLKAMRRGAGAESFILGCNVPMWPSLGLVDGMRLSNDIDRTWNSFKETARENLGRTWQNGILWWNDPDMIILTGKLSENEIRFHNSVLHAIGGAMINGDNAMKLSASDIKTLEKMVTSTGSTVVFNNEKKEIGWINTSNEKRLIILNWSDNRKTFTVKLEKSYQIINYWTGENLGTFKNQFVIKDMPGRDGNVYILK